jgi:hypothetical protein
MTKSRVAVGLLVSPLATVCLMLVWYAFIETNVPPNSISDAAIIAGTVMVVAYPALLLAAPVIWFFHRRTISGWVAYLSAGACVGLIYTLILASGGMLNRPDYLDELFPYAWFSFCGLVSGGLFRAIVGSHAGEPLPRHSEPL